MASDAHNTKARNPLIDQAVERLIECAGKDVARRMVVDRPQEVLDNLQPGAVAPVPSLAPGRSKRAGKPWYKRLFAKG